MDITLDPDLPVPTLRLAGRFDGDGATAFDLVERLIPPRSIRSSISPASSRLQHGAAAS